MTGNALLAIIGGIVIAALVRLVNVVGAWLARVLDVEPPDPVVNPLDVRARRRDTPGPPGE